MSVHKCVKEPVDRGRAFVRERNTCLGAFVWKPTLTTQIRHTMGAAGVVYLWYNYFTSTLLEE